MENSYYVTSHFSNSTDTALNVLPLPLGSVLNTGRGLQAKVNHRVCSQGPGERRARADTRRAVTEQGLTQTETLSHKNGKEGS